MTSIQITSKVDLDQLISGIAQLETSELEVCVEKMSLLLAQRKAASLSTPTKTNEQEGESPWTKFSGIFKDDPDFEEIVQEMRAEREGGL